MATLTRDNMIEKVLRRLNVIGAGQAATADDKALVGDTLDSVHDQLEKRQLVDFPTSAFPEWSQEPFAKIMTFEVGPYFGVNDRGLDRKLGERELAEQLQAKRHNRPTEARYY